MNRRGILYLFGALLFVAIILTIFFARTLPTSEERQESVVTRIRTTNDFLRDLHADVPRATYIASFRAFLSLDEQLYAQGAYFTNVTPLFAEAFLNGTIDGDANHTSLLVNSTFTDYLARVNAEAADIGLALNMSVDQVRLSQSSPWTVDVSFLMHVNVTDSRGLARWDYDRWFTTEVSIIGLHDPSYTVGTDGLLLNVIEMSPYNNTQFVSGNDTTVLEDELRSRYYRDDPYAPSFLQRLEGNLTGSSKYGIASLVDLDEISAQGLAVRTDRTLIDAAYFANASTVNYCPGSGSLPNWFKLDAAHYSAAEHDYELSKLNATTC